MARTVGLPFHLGYPILSAIFLAIASFGSADSLWYVSVTTATETVRFCGIVLNALYKIDTRLTLQIRFAAQD